MSTQMIPVIAAPVLPETHRQASSDEQLIGLWLHGRNSAETIRAYRADAIAFLRFVGKRLHEVTLVDLQRYADDLDGGKLEPASRHRRLSSIKSLFAFCHEIGILPFDVARPLRLPAIRDRLAERILTEGEVQQMLVLERHPRNSALLYLLYASGVRVSEACRLKWRDCCDREDGGQVTVFGKGAKTNTIRLPSSVWVRIGALRATATSPDDPVFRSRRGGHLDPTQVRRIVRRAARRAGIEKKVSPHWLRHCCGSHSIQRGAPLPLIQQTLGHSSLATTSRYLHSRPNESAATFLPL